MLLYLLCFDSVIDGYAFKSYNFHGSWRLVSNKPTSNFKLASNINYNFQSQQSSHTQHRMTVVESVKSAVGLGKATSTCT